MKGVKKGGAEDGVNEEQNGADEVHEQKARAGDFERQKAIIPQAELRSSKSTEDIQDSEGEEGQRTPGDAGFQDVAL